MGTERRSDDGYDYKNVACDFEKGKIFLEVF